MDADKTILFRKWKTPQKHKENSLNGTDNWICVLIALLFIGSLSRIKRNEITVSRFKALLDLLCVRFCLLAN